MQPVFTQRAVIKETQAPFAQTMWAQGPIHRGCAVIFIALWTAWCVTWAVIWAHGGPIGYVLAAVSLAAAVWPFVTTTKRTHGYISQPMPPTTPTATPPAPTSGQ
jgi:hypothetical protein